MSIPAAIRQSPNVRALRAAYDLAAAQRQRHAFVYALVLLVALALAAETADIDPRTFFARIGNAGTYFDRIFTLDTGARVWTSPSDWLWDLPHWVSLLGQTLLMSYAGTLTGAVLAVAASFLAASNVAPAPWAGFATRRFLEFCRTVPAIVFALIFVIAFGLGPAAGVLAIAIHSTGALGKLFAELIENAEMKPAEGIFASGGHWLTAMRFGILPQVLPGFASYGLLRFEINVRGASIMGFVGAGGIGEDLIVAVRKFYYSDVSAILVLIVVCVMVIDLSTGWLRNAISAHAGPE